MLNEQQQIREHGSFRDIHSTVVGRLEDAIMFDSHFTSDFYEVSYRQRVRLEVYTDTRTTADQQVCQQENLQPTRCPNMSPCSTASIEQ